MQPLREGSVLLSCCPPLDSALNLSLLSNTKSTQEGLEEARGQEWGKGDLQSSHTRPLTVVSQAREEPQETDKASHLKPTKKDPAQPPPPPVRERGGVVCERGDFQNVPIHRSQPPVIT